MSYRDLKHPTSRKNFAAVVGQNHALILTQCHNHIGCICLASLHCVSSNVSSNGLPERMQSHIDCICLAFLHCASSNVSSNRLSERMHTQTGCICLIFLCPLFLLLKPDWLCFYYNLLVQNPFPAYKKCAVSCNSCFQLKAHWFWIAGTEIESESQNRFSRLRKIGPPIKIINWLISKCHFDIIPLPWSILNTIKCEWNFKEIKIGWFYELL